MSRQAASFVLGFHGCDAETARKVVNCEEDLQPSDKDYDWLGHGAYFWEPDPQRACKRIHRRFGYDDKEGLLAIIAMRHYVVIKDWGFSVD